MTAAEAVDRAEEFLLEFDPEGNEDARMTPLVAMAILYGEKVGLRDGHELALDAMARVRQEFASA